MTDTIPSLGRIVRTLTLGVVISVSSFAQGNDPADQRFRDSETGGQLNGRFWTSIPDAAKLGFVMGFCAAATGDLTCPTAAQYGEIEKGIDRFYQEPENLRLPIFIAVEVFARRLAGASEANIQNLLESARRVAASSK